MLSRDVLSRIKACCHQFFGGMVFGIFHCAWWVCTAVMRVSCVWRCHSEWGHSAVSIVFTTAVPILPAAGMPGIGSESSGGHDYSDVSWPPLSGYFRFVGVTACHGSGCIPSHLTSHDPSFGNPGFFTSHPSHPAHINAMADSSPPLPGR